MTAVRYVRKTSALALGLSGTASVRDRPYTGDSRNKGAVAGRVGGTRRIRLFAALPDAPRTVGLRQLRPSHTA